MPLTNSELKRLPYGLPVFSSIRLRNKIYVDKTNLIYEFAAQDAPIFFARPRRFGKSLLVNTLHSLFEKGLEDFHGLAIENIWKDKTYKVVHLDFSSLACQTTQDLKLDLGEKIIQEFCVQKEVALFNELGWLRNPNRILDEIAQKLEDNSTVLLIDEYDAPIVHHINEPEELKSIIAILGDFYAVIKQYTDKFRFIFITGVTRTSHVSIFSAFNNILDLSFEEDFNTLLGFTQDDLEKYFDPYVENAAQILNLNKEEVYHRIKHHYDGYQFAFGTQDSVYNPWSILSFFKYSEDGFKNYWYESGGTASILMQYLKTDDKFNFLDYAQREKLVDKNVLSSKYEITKIPIDVLLYQAGYFTLRKKQDGAQYLVVPNVEVEASLLKLYLSVNNLQPSVQLNQKMRSISEAIDCKNLRAIVDVFNEILNECGSSSSTIFKDERAIRDLIYAAFLFIEDIKIVKERDTVKGRSDLELSTKKTSMIIEFKRTYSTRGPKAALNQALEQLANNRYGLILNQNQVIYRVGMVISTERKMILYDFCAEVP